MKKKSYMMILACCLLFCVGCSAGRGVGIEELGTGVVQESSNRPENMGTSSSDINTSSDVFAEENRGSDQPQDGDKKTLDSVLVQSGLEQFKSVDKIQYAGEDRILLFADKIYLYELTKQKVIAEAEYPDSNGNYGNLRTWITDSGYCMAYRIFSENQETQTSTSQSMIFGGDGGTVGGSSHIIYAYYDANLCFQKNIDVTALGADVEFIHQTAPSRDGGQIVACELGKGIFLYDVETLAKTEVLQVDGKEYAKLNGLSSVNQVAFAENDSRIVFLGNCIENGKGYICYGNIKTDGSSLVIHRENTFDVMSVYTEHTLFSEELPDDRTSGQVWVYYPSLDMSQVVQMSEKIESSHVWGSDQGNYFITAVRNDNVGWTLRLYDVRTLKLVSTKIYEVANTDDYREPHICYLEEQQMAVLLQHPYGDNQQCKVGIESFGDDL